MEIDARNIDFVALRLKLNQQSVKINNCYETKVTECVTLMIILLLLF